MLKENKIIVQIDPDIKPLIPGFLELKKKSIEKIKKLFKNGKIDEIIEITHKMKGSWGTYGFKDLSKLACDLEKDLIKKDEVKFQNKLTRMEDYIKNMEIIFV
ncbi:Hpt domain-containing protein [Candidatus Margulisiibacteriota bacterium]